MKQLPTDRWCYLFDPNVSFDIQLRRLKQLYPYEDKWSPLSRVDLEREFHRSGGLNVTLGYVPTRTTLSYGERSNVHNILNRQPHFPIFHLVDLDMGIRRQLTT